MEKVTTDSLREACYGLILVKGADDKGARIEHVRQELAGEFEKPDSQILDELIESEIDAVAQAMARENRQAEGGRTTRTEKELFERIERMRKVVMKARSPHPRDYDALFSEVCGDLTGEELDLFARLCVWKASYYMLEYRTLHVIKSLARGLPEFVFYDEEEENWREEIREELRQEQEQDEEGEEWKKGVRSDDD
jgi:hypothetical protein